MSSPIIQYDTAGNEGTARSLAAISQSIEADRHELIAHLQSGSHNAGGTHTSHDDLIHQANEFYNRQQELVTQFGQTVIRVNTNAADTDQVGQQWYAAQSI